MGNDFGGLAACFCRDGILEVVPPRLLKIESQLNMNIVCAHCGAVNRLPATKTHDTPVCGACKQNLLPDHPVELTDANFNKFITRTELPILVDFWAPWCGPCRMMAPNFAEAAKQLATQVIFAKLNTEQHQRTAAQFNISGIPTLILFVRGKEHTRQSGLLNTQQIIQFTKS